MSQQLTPLNGGTIPDIATTTSNAGLNVLSPQFIEAKGLNSRPTEWIPDGRPIYRRLPATGETYQVDFFNLVTESNITGNTFVGEGVEEVGYVYVPYGESINGPTSIEVVSSDSKTSLLIKGGSIVWKYGKNNVLPAIIDLQVLDVLPGAYDLAYELIYDNSPVPRLYAVEDFSLAGFPLDITSSTDGITGWRYNAVNAFITESSLFWSNQDTLFSSSVQPTESFLQWESDLNQSYTRVLLRCPLSTAHEGSATLFYVRSGNIVEVQTVEIQRDSEGQFFEFAVEQPSLESGWRVSFSSLDMSILSITVSGVITILAPEAGYSPRSALVIYPSGTTPSFVTTSAGQRVPATYCFLATVDVLPDYKIGSIQDIRSIIHRDYTPVADWLTKPFDEDLIDLYEQVSEYVPLWMSPTTCMDQEYLDLTTEQVQVES